MGLTGYQKEVIENYYVEMYYLLSGYAVSVLRNYALAEEAVQEDIPYCLHPGGYAFSQSESQGLARCCFKECYSEYHLHAKAP